MRRYSICSLLCLLSLISLLGEAIADKLPELPTVELTASIHFLTPGGEDVLVPAGTYHIEPAESWLKLLPAGGTRSAMVLIEANQGRHEELVTEAFVLAEPEEPDADIFHLAVLLPDGTGLEAVGSSSGIRSRKARLTFLQRRTLKSPTRQKRQTRQPLKLPTQDSAIEREITRLQQLMRQGPQAVPDKQTVVSPQARQRDQALVQNLLELRTLIQHPSQDLPDYETSPARDPAIDQEIVRIQTLMRQGPNAVPDKQTVISPQAQQRDDQLVQDVLKLRKLLQQNGNVKRP